MILWEIKEILKKFLEENLETVIIEDSNEVYAEDIVFHLEYLFRSLKCDFRIEKIMNGKYKVVLFH